MEVEIRKRVDTNKIVGDLNMVRADMCDDTLDTGEKERIVNTCVEAALVITELCYQLRNTKEALDKANGTKTDEKENSKKQKKKPSCFGEYDPEEAADDYSSCRMFCELEEECKKETEKKQSKKTHACLGKYNE